jgi:hypothetical protein
MSGMFVERLLQPQENEHLALPGVRYDEVACLTVREDGTPLVETDSRYAGTETKAGRDKDAVGYAKETRADRDKPRGPRARAGKKTSANRDRPSRPHAGRSRPGDERVTAVRADKPRARFRPLA